ncbi:MAG TPA: choice-of-anchor E domain-containing protein [Puia sp.]|nr:choice-of-anchor E domain-containing protein [Puia sp.]
MNRVYTTVFIIAMLIVNAPRITYAQCNCSATVPATPISYYSSFPATNAATTTVSFPQFNPSIGTLACVSLNDTVTGVSTTSALNKASSSVSYKFQLTVSNDLEGPPGGGISISNSYNRVYGPTTLTRLGFPGDTVTYGPDTIFNNEIGFASTSSGTAAYLGTGTADFTYSLSGGVVSLQGGLNYTAGPTTDYWGAFKLTYYWCPASILATTIIDFTATPGNGAVLLQWQASNQQPNTQYEIQISTDGKNFYPVGEAEGDASATGTSTKYQYQYNPDPANMGKLYFRIEEKDPSGKVSYSVVLVADPSASGKDNNVSYQTFPNPATNSLQVLFNGSQTGHFLVELVAASGQVVQKKAVTLTGSNQIRLDLSPQPVKGLYFLRTTDLTHEHSYVSKVFIN